MEIRVVEAPTTPPKRKTPAQVAKGRKTVPVFLEAAITLELDGSTLVTYSPGEHAAPCEVANALFAQGAERVGPDGSFVKRDSAKPAHKRYPNPFGGSMRYKI
jgi:hypothetical protein